MPPTEVQPVKSDHQRIKGPHRNQDTTNGDKAETEVESGMVTWHPTIQPCVAQCSLQCMTDEECEQQYLNSFHTKMVTLSNGQQLHPHVALQQLCAGVISKEDIVQDDDSDEGKNIPESLKDVMEPVDEGNFVMDDQGNKQSGMNSNHITILWSSTPDGSIQYEGSTESSDEHSDWSTDKRCSLKLEQTRQEIHNENYDFNHHPSTPPLEFPSSSEDEDATMDIEDDSQKTKRKYACPLTDVSWATSRTVDKGVDTDNATWAESVWNMHQACHQMKHYKDHKDEEEFPQLWAEICMFWSKSISGSKDTSFKVMVGQVMACRDSFTQVVQTCGSDEAACQAQGIFAGSMLCMQLAGEKQMDISKLLDYLASIVKYKVLDSAASVPLPDFTVLSQPPYDQTLALKPQESRHDHNCHVLPVVFMHKLYKANLVGGQRNVPWKTLLDVLYTAQYTVVDWPAHVPAMGVDYHAETPGEDEDEDGSMVVPSSLFDLKKWTPDSQAFLRVLPRGVLPPRNQLMSSLPPSSPLEELPQPSQLNSLPLPQNEELPQLPRRGCIQEGTIIVLLNMYIETIPASGTMAMIWMMKTIIDIIAMQATKYPDDTATVGF
ncbi:hypothetical protein EDC04DRAFT_2610698 [Pisolithus marmoratus]|nr:hypothetical protein EDC04DRAFT_2610698 [Pisolithus marmoratus]